MNACGAKETCGVAARHEMNEGDKQTNKQTAAPDKLYKTIFAYTTNTTHTQDNKHDAPHETRHTKHYINKKTRKNKLKLI